MIRVLVAALFLLGAHFAGTYLVPSPAGKASFYWPWAQDPGGWAVLGERAALVPAQWQVLQPVAALAAFAYLAAFLALFGWLVPPAWAQPLAVAGSVASIALFAAHLGPLAILPTLLDLIVLWGVFGMGWKPESLAGA